MNWYMFGQVWLGVLIAIGIAGFLIGMMALLAHFDAPEWVMVVVPFLLFCIGFSVVLGVVTP
jgi:hypothetical protein